MSGRVFPGDLLSTRTRDGRVVHPLSFVKLGENLQYYELAVDWLDDILRHYKGFNRELIHGRLRAIQDTVYLGLLSGQPIAMCCLRNHAFSPELAPYLPSPKWLFGIYVDKPYRKLGLFRQLMQHSKQQAIALKASILLFDVIFTQKLSMYEKSGAKVIRRDADSLLACELVEPKHPVEVAKPKVLPDVKDSVESSRKGLLVGATIFFLAGLIGKKIQGTTSRHYL